MYFEAVFNPSENLEYSNDAKTLGGRPRAAGVPVHERPAAG